MMKIACEKVGDVYTIQRSNPKRQTTRVNDTLCFQSSSDAYNPLAIRCQGQKERSAGVVSIETGRIVQRTPNLFSAGRSKEGIDKVIIRQDYHFLLIRSTIVQR